MNRSKKKSFDWYGARQRFSIRKYHIGAASVLLGTTLVLGTGTIVGAETGVNGGTSNGQIVPGNGTGTSDGTQPQGDNQGNNSSGVQTGNTTNSTANVQPADDTGSASSQPVGTSRSANTGTQGDGSTNPTVDEPIIKFPTSESDPVPNGYVLVSFQKPEYGSYVFNNLPGEFPNATKQSINSRPIQLEVRFWVKEGTTWGQLIEDPNWRWPTMKPNDGDVFIDWNIGYGYSNRFDFNKKKDQPVTTTYFFPVVGYEVEEVEPLNANVNAFLAWYSPEGKSKWLIVTFDAGKGSMTYKNKQYTSRSVAAYFQGIGYDNRQFTSKVVSPTLANHTFVRWQTQDGKVLPKSGTITTETTYEALYLAHPENQVAVFDSKKLTDSEKEQVKKNILDANPNLSTGVPQVIKAIDISATGEATVTFDDGTAVKVPSATLTNEDKATARSNAKAEIEKDAMEKSAAINASNLTEEEKRARLTEVRDVQDRADIAIDNAATTEDLTKAISDGTAAIEAVSTTSTIKTKAKEALEEAYNTKKDEIDNSSLTAEEKSAKQEELDQAKSAADSAIDTATDDAGVGTALNKGKADIEAIETIISDKKIAARQQLEDAYSAKETEITNSNLTLEEKATKLAELDKAKEVAENAIDTATDNAGVDTALTNGQSAISGIDTSSSAKKAQAKQDLETAYNTEKAEIENSVLTADEKAIKQADLSRAKENAINAVDDATTDSAVEEALKNGKVAIESTYTAIIKIPSSASESAPEGYVTVTFNKSPWDKGLTLGNQSGNSVRIFVKNDVTWATLLSDPAWQWPTVNTNSGDIVVGWGSHTNYSASVAFVYDKMKDQVVRNTQLWPNVVYEVEDVHSTIDAYLKQYGADEQDKWLFVTFDAGQGATLKGTTNQSKSVAVYYQNIGYDNSLFTKKVVNGVLANHTFVRWQTADGKVLPTSGTITSTEVYNALYLAHPTDKTTVFDANKLTETEKDSLKQAISNANPTSANLIQNITVSDTGEATVTYNDGTVVTVPASHLINEDKAPARNLAKEEIDKASKEKVAEINASALTDEEKAAKLTEVQEAKDRANNAIDNATTTEDLTKAISDGTAAIEAINTTTSPKKTAAKQALQEAYNAKKDAITNSGLTAEEKDAKQAELDKAKEDADKAIDAATDNAGVDTALEAGKTAIAGIDTSTSPKKAAAKEELKAAAEDAKKAIDANDNLTDAEKQAAKDAVDAEVAKAEKAIDAATKADEVDAATLAGTAAIAEDVLDAAKQDAKNKIAKDVEAANAAIESNPNLSEKEIADAKAEVADEAKKANDAIDAATTPEAAQAAEEAGTKAIAADVLDAAKQDAKNKIAKDLATVEAAIDANSNLSQDEKDAAKLAAQAKEAEAVANIEKATTPEAAQTLEDAAVKELANIEIKAAYDDAVKAIEAADNLSTAAKTQALEDLKKARQAAEEAIKTASTADEVAKGALDGLKSIAKVEATAAADDAKAAIAQNSNLTDAEKKVYTDAIDEALKDTETKIDAATDADTVDAETVLAQKDIAKQEVAAATADAVKGIEANTNLTDAEKDEYKATVTKAAETAEKAITDATTAADIQSKTFDATQDVAKEEVKADAADAIAGIKANDNLSDTAKEEAIAAIEEARDTTLENIENAKTAAEVDTATLDAEKANAKAEIKAAADDAKKAIDENANLPESDKNALKLAIDAEVAATNLEIDNAKTAEEIDAATLATEKSIAKAEVKAAAEDALQAIDENANLTDDEKAKAKADVYVELSKAEKAIDKATTADAIDNATLVGEKAFATAELEAAADDAKKAIDENANLPASDKNALKLAIDAEVAATNLEIDNAKTAEEIDAATLATEKSIAKAEVKAAAEDALQAIDENANLTDDEKAKAKADVYVELSKAENAIDKATTADVIDNATLVGEKAFATAELEAAADDAKKAIDANTHLTDDQKQAAKDAVDAELAKAKESVVAAKTADEVDAATLVGEKAVAKEEIKAAAEDAKKAIDANSNLTDDEKAAAKAAVDDEVAKANEAIDKAATADAVDTATLVGEKAVAKEELKAAADDAKKAIDENANLTPEEKAAAKKAVDDEVAKAEKAIDAATKADEVDAATLAG
ncbi:TPA: DUF1542 domain-containing protein, partial [Streptococcus suis]|nr:DUF1542 domain-containing protein [Streptococcus suis]